MSTTRERGESSQSNATTSKTTQTTTTITHHDGHIDGHLNCVALRHGWSRTFSISPDELATLDYASLEAILELHTLRLRPVGLRIFVEHPPNSENWLKVKVWKRDQSLQAALIRDFFEERRREGIITRVEVKDGADRPDGDALSLRSVGSRIAQTVTGGKRQDNTAKPERSWFSFVAGFGRTKKAAQEPVHDHDAAGEESLPPTPPPKSSFFSISLLRPHPRIGAAPERRSLFDFFRRKPAIQLPPDDTNLSPEERHQAEVETLRRRGWVPPTLSRRQKSLRERLRANAGEEPGRSTIRNPFFGSSKSLLSRAERRGGKRNATEDDGAEGEEMLTGAGPPSLIGHDPFGDDAEMMPGAEPLTEQDVDDFFEVERSSQNLELSNRPGSTKPWSRFKPSKDRKGTAPLTLARKTSSVFLPPKGQLGGGAEVVSKPRDAFPDSPHHRAAEEAAKEPSTDTRI